MTWRDHFKLKEFGLSYGKPLDFVSLQHGPQVLYVILTALWLAYHLIWILMEAYWSANSTPGKWMLLLTNLSYLALAVFSLIDFLCSVFVFCRRVDILNGAINCLPWYMKVQWISFNICGHAALQVTLLYWVMLATSTKASTINKHGINLLHILLLVCFSAKPIKFQHVYMAVVSSAIYIFINVIYYSATSKILYPFLDWTKPGKASPLSLLFVFISTPLSFFFLFGIYKLRIYIYARIIQRKDKNRNFQIKGEEELVAMKLESIALRNSTGMEKNNTLNS